MNKIFIILIVIFGGIMSKAISQNITPIKNSSLIFYVGKEVINANDENEKQIIQLWKDYLVEGKFEDKESPFWSFEDSNVPDSYLWAVGVENIANLDYQVQCKIIGVFPVKNDYYCLKSAFTHLDNKGEIHLDVIPTVYAKKYNGKFLLVNSATYHKEILEYHKVGNISYFVHPSHKFDLKKAKFMSEFSEKTAAKFSSKPIECTYFVANTSREIVEIWGYEYMDRMYRPEQTGGVAITNDNILYCGNNSEYYPHELIHLYTHNINNNFPHFWINEGIATYFGGSTEKSFEWHLNELKDFHKENPMFDYADIEKIGTKDIPNGKHLTEFRYIIGAIIIRNIYEKYGIVGIKDALKIGDTNNDFFNFTKDKLGITKNTFSNYIKEQLEN